MKKIALTQGKKALVDDHWYDYLMQWKWYAHWQSTAETWYAVRNEIINDNRTSVKIHREIMRLAEGDSRQVDHKDHNGLNNCESNLRIAARSQQQANRRKQSNNTSGYKGVSWHESTRKWRAYTKINGRYIHLGLFENLEEAARAYDEAALKHFGEFACLNFLLKEAG